MKITLPGCYPIHIGGSVAHWRPNGTHHGPKSSPKWIALSWVRLDLMGDSEGRRLWIYARGGYALFAEAWVDRRPVTP